MDRIDLHVEVTPVRYDELSTFEKSKITSEDIAVQVIRARKIQEERFKGFKNIYCNAMMPFRMVSQVCQLDETGLTLLKQRWRGYNYPPGL